jgi:preprotein translocase subunit Sec61beta
MKNADTRKSHMRALEHDVTQTPTRAGCRHLQEQDAYTYKSRMQTPTRAGCIHLHEQDADTYKSRMQTPTRAGCIHLHEQDASIGALAQNIPEVVAAVCCVLAFL